VFAVTADGVAVQKSGAQNLSAPESWNNFRFTSDINAASGTKIIGYNGQRLLATSSGIFSFSNNSWQQFLLPGENVQDLLVSGNILYIATTNIIYKYENSVISKLYENAGLTFNSITVSDKQSIYVSSNNGVVEFANNKARIIYPNGPANNNFMNLSVDPLGRLWVATGKDATGAGFYEYDGSKWRIFNTTLYPQLLSNAFYNVFAGPDTAIYLSNWGSGATIFKNNIFTTYNSSNSPLVGIAANAAFVSISDIKTDSKGNIWILNNETTSQNPLSVLTTDKTWYSFAFTNPPITADPTGELVIDPYDTKWFSIIDTHRGLYYFNENNTFNTLGDDTKGVISTGDGLNSDLITALAVDLQGYIWVGTSLGLNVITNPTSPKSSNAIRNIYALSNQPVTCVAVDPLNQKWVGATQGIIVLEPDGYQVVAQYNSTNSPLPDDNITSITFDNKNGIVYIGTDYGLASLQTSSLEPKDSFEDLFVYPNPFIINGNDSKNVTIDGLIRSASIKIFGISGNLIRDFDSPGGRVAFWDGRDANGNLVPTGIYIIVAYDSEANNVKTSKVAVIRK
jgi:ligand-binding sensor domain-containing protein